VTVGLASVSALFVVASLGYVATAELRRLRATWLTKPFAMPLLAIAYSIAAAAPDPWIVAGLLLGAAGDILLIPQRKQLFFAGLVAFLAGHLAYTVALLSPVVARVSTVPWTVAAAAPLAVIGLLAYRGLRPGLGGMKTPVAIYVTVILTMTLAAMVRAGVVPSAAFWFPLVGALLFLVSDLVLAWGRFREPFSRSKTVVALTYVCAQAFIVAGFL